jgi:pimeloyl-ACP methyl ester carboxylesterase
MGESSREAVGSILVPNERIDRLALSEFSNIWDASAERNWPASCPDRYRTGSALHSSANSQPIVFGHGWPLSADDWDTRMREFTYDQDHTEGNVFVS